MTIHDPVTQEQPSGQNPNESTCRECGCTDSHLCETQFGPCLWINLNPEHEDHPICSGCALAGRFLTAEEQEAVAIRLRSFAALSAVAEVIIRATAAENEYVP